MGTKSTTKLLCPNCNKSIPSAWSWVFYDGYSTNILNEEPRTYNCPHCKNDFIGRVETEYMFYGEKIKKKCK